MEIFYAQNSNALVATDSKHNVDWVLVFGATLHIIIDSSQVLNSHKPYYGAKQVTIRNGDLLPIYSYDQGLLPTPNRSLILKSLLQFPPFLTT